MLNKTDEERARELIEARDGSDNKTYPIENKTITLNEDLSDNRLITTNFSENKKD